MNISNNLLKLYKQNKAWLAKEKVFINDTVRVLQGKNGNFYLSVFSQNKLDKDEQFVLTVYNQQGQEAAKAITNFAVINEAPETVELGEQSYANLFYMEVFEKKRNGLGALITEHNLDVLQNLPVEIIHANATSDIMCRKNGWAENSAEAKQFKQSWVVFFERFGFKASSKPENCSGIHMTRTKAAEAVFASDKKRIGDIIVHSYPEKELKK